jgi:hydroxymethylbilane synthase
MIQSRHVQSLLSSAFPGVEFVIRTSSTLGDDVQNVPLSVVGSANPGLFTKNLEVGIVAGAYDLAVHSLKDMPTMLPAGLVLGAITTREDPSDAVVLHPSYVTSVGGANKGPQPAAGNASSSATFASSTLAALPAGAIVGTSSLRRQALVARMYPHVKVISIRGNLNTRMKKLDDSVPFAERQMAAAAGAAAVATPGAGEYGEGERQVHYDAIILATAGLKRMGWGDRISQTFDPSEFPYGVSQGALGIECRADDAWVLEQVVRTVNDRDAATRCLAERAFLRGLQGGCQVPIGVSTELHVDTGKMELRGVVLSLDGKQCIDEQGTMVFSDGTIAEMAAKAEALGASLAEAAKKNGADELLGRGDQPRPITYSQVAQ